mgnify:CR=1 FL=1
MIYMTDKELFNELSYKRKNVYENLSEQEYKEMFELCDEYREFLDEGKTERECVEKSIKMAELHGFKNINSVKQLKAGDKVYKINRNKNILLAVIGSEDIKNGVNLVGAHIDSPRLDLKQNPLYESNDMALLKTHYYGGIKKYQWTAIPLAMHGVIFTKEGKKVTLNIGENENDPVFCVTDLLPHLAKDQMTKKMIDGIEGENLNILIGGMPVKSEDVSEKVKFAILKHLNEKYGITERDFLSAEIEIVPAFKAKNVGLDESFVGAYGQDDRVCAFTSLFAMLDVKEAVRTSCCILVDKEEIGSVGATGMHSRFFENVVAELVALTEGESELKVRRALQNSRMLSSDVSAAYDPMYAEAFEKRSAAFFGKGLVFNKFTGARGKSGSNDANAEYLAEIRRAMNTEDISYQFAELGKVDIGGGGTIAYIMANYGMEVIDSGVAVLSMHAPWEVTSKADVYEAYRGYKSFLRNI